jgi:hypothetical protein
MRCLWGGIACIARRALERGYEAWFSEDRGLAEQKQMTEPEVGTDAVGARRTIFDELAQADSR